MNWLDRTELLLGKDKLGKLKSSHVLVVGLGGVGAYAAELICRAGVGKMTIVDGDVVEKTNRNRQLPALISSEGKQKTEILAQRFSDINPDLELIAVSEFIHDQGINNILDKNSYDYVVDAIDTLSPKTLLLYQSLLRGYKVVSSMGAGGKTDPSKVMVTDISKTYNCRLAKMLRKRLSGLGVTKGITVVFSPEVVEEIAIRAEETKNKKSVVGTISYMPAVFGCFIAGVVIRGLLY